MPKREHYTTYYFPQFQISAEFDRATSIEALAKVVFDLATRTVQELSEKRVSVRVQSGATQERGSGGEVTLRLPEELPRLEKLLQRPGGINSLNVDGQKLGEMFERSFCFWASAPTRSDQPPPTVQLDWTFVHKQGIQQTRMPELIRRGFELLAEVGSCVRASGNFACTDEHNFPDSIGFRTAARVYPTSLQERSAHELFPKLSAFPLDFVQLLTPEVLRAAGGVERLLAVPELSWPNYAEGTVSERRAEVKPLANGYAMVSVIDLTEDRFDDFRWMRDGRVRELPINCGPGLAWLLMAYHEVGLFPMGMGERFRASCAAWAEARRQEAVRENRMMFGEETEPAEAREALDEEALRVSLVRARLAEVKGRAPSFLKGRVLRGGSPDVVREGLSEVPSAVWRIAEPGTTHAHTLWGAPSDYDMRFLSPVYVGSPRKDEALVVIDATRSGYDAIHKNIKPTKRGATRQLRCPKCWHDQFRLAVGLEYDADVLQDAGTTPAEELFSWLWLFAACTQCNWKKCVLDEECA